ncbi:hypothetical protein SAMN04487949_2704 [Halogranum gelatinilyticum]|uniref:DoxX-like family protein n=1 Tax=Halogranum gelatinilyticum TaxID=660521 RepID=A0A1G9WCA3_9EURY|nr:hypothetical protein [Halogranum gelatinilyticum]SDM82204.1 hypothetical protein SAMN04487949_2704 [Halogranum gelatinilyticum]
MSPFDWLFPTWSDPLAIAVFVGLRVLANSSLTLLVARVAGSAAVATKILAGGTALSAVVTVSVLRPGGLGLTASYVELLVQVGLLVIAGYAVYSRPTDRRTGLATALVLVVAALLTLATVPLYGEALVAP